MYRQTESVNAITTESLQVTKVFNLVTGNRSGTKLPEFHAKLLLKILYAQDTPHLGAKLRSRLISSWIVMPMEYFIVFVAHIKVLMQNVSKEHHLLLKKISRLKIK